MKSSKFEAFQKDCKFRTFQANKCVNEKNKDFRLVNSCVEKLCPIFKDARKEQKVDDQSRGSQAV